MSIVYIARYLGVKRYEDLGKGLGGGKVFRAVLRVLMVLAGIGILVLYLRSESPVACICIAPRSLKLTCARLWSSRQ